MPWVRSAGWLHNVQAQPKVEVQLGRTTQPATASVVERGDADYERLWRLVNENNGNRYDAYQRRTDRPIPIVVLDPTGGRGGAGGA